jgi:hypothetical protein
MLDVGVTAGIGRRLGDLSIRKDCADGDQKATCAGWLALRVRVSGRRARPDGRRRRCVLRLFGERLVWRGRLRFSPFWCPFAALRRERDVFAEVLLVLEIADAELGGALLVGFGAFGCESACRACGLRELRTSCGCFLLRWDRISC